MTALTPLPRRAGRISYRARGAGGEPGGEWGFEDFTLTRDRAGQFSARVAGGLRLIVKPSRQPPPAKPDGGLDWPAIDSVTVIEVVDYHD